MFKYNSSQFALQKLITQVLQVVNLKFALIYRAAAVKKKFYNYDGFWKFAQLAELTFKLKTYLFLLLVEVVDDDSNEEIEGKEGAEDDEEHKVEIHVDVDLSNRLLANLESSTKAFVNIYYSLFFVPFLLPMNPI